MTLSRRRFLAASLAGLGMPTLAMNCLTGCGGLKIDSAEISDAVFLNRNENPLGPSPLAVAAISEKLLGCCNRYLDPACLKKALAIVHGLSEDMIAIGSGSTDLLQLAPELYNEQSANIVTFKEALCIDHLFAQFLDENVRLIPLNKDWSFDIEGILNAVDHNTRAVFVINPNNPTGSFMDYEACVYLLNRISEDILFFLDEAYMEFMPEGTKNGIDLIHEGWNNVVVARTFSKIYGLAGMRVGYVAASSGIIGSFKEKMIIEYLFVNCMGVYAAKAALMDKDHVARTLANTRASRSFFENAFTSLGLEYIVGDTPFILVKLGETAEVIKAELEARKIYVTSGASMELPGYLRVSYGLPKENRIFLNNLSEILPESAVKTPV